MPELEKQPSPGSTRPVVILLATILACLPVLVVSQFIAHARVDEFDAWLFAYYGREMLDGRELYADLWDNKPPGIFWMNAFGLWTAGGGLTGVYVLCAIAVVGSAAIVFVATKRLYGWSPAGLATVLAALYLNIWPYHVGSNRPSTFYVLTELACFALYCLGLSRPERRRSALRGAGRAGALSVCFMQTALAATAAVVFHTLYLAVRRQVPLREAGTRLRYLAEGWLTIVVLVVLALLWSSDLKWAWNAVVGFNRMYFLPRVGSSLIPPFFAVEEHLRVLGLPLILAGATLVQPLLRRFLGGAREKDDDPSGARPAGLLFLLWAWLLCGLYLALVGPHKRLPYFGVALPPLVMLSAHGVYLLLRSGRRLTQTQPTYHVVVGGLWLGYMLIFPLQKQVEEGGKQYYHRFIEGSERHYVEAVAAIQRYVRPDETIFVFGYGPQLYWDVDRPSAIRYIGTEKAAQLGSHGQPLFDEITALLIQAKPKALLVDPDDFERSSLADGLDTSELEAWIRAHYARPEDGRPSGLWLRRK
ncbi:MAG: hypothetical protein V2A79_05075 [Planctomycetota bacterium]